MPKNKKVALVAKKQKLSPAERSQIAKDRWAKRRESASITPPPQPVSPEQPGNRPPPAAPNQPVIPQNPTPEQPPVAPESISPIPNEVKAIEMGMQEVKRKDEELVRSISNATPAPQLTPVAPKKQKRYTGPKEFSVALKAAESRLAKAIVERAEAAGKMAMLQAEIPSLVQIINALRGPQNYIPAQTPNFLANDFPGHYSPNALSGDPTPAVQFPPYVDPLAAIAGAAAAPPVSRASGGAVQFGPDVLGQLEGPEDEDEDRFLRGGGVATEGKWV